MSQQFTLCFDPSLAERHRCVRDVVAAGVYSRDLKRIAAEIEMAPGNLSAALSGESRCLSVDQLEAYITKTGDLTPIHYLVARFIGSNPEQIAAARAERSQRLLEEAIALMRETVPRAKGQR